MNMRTSASLAKAAAAAAKLVNARPEGTQRLALTLKALGLVKVRADYDFTCE